MTSINEKLGFKRPGKRAMMHLPDDPAARADLTATQCPECTHRGIIENLVHGKRWRTCIWCGHGWEPV